MLQGCWAAALKLFVSGKSVSLQVFSGALCRLQEGCSSWNTTIAPLLEASSSQARVWHCPIHAVHAARSVLLAWQSSQQHADSSASSRAPEQAPAKYCTRMYRLFASSSLHSVAGPLNKSTPQALRLPGYAHALFVRYSCMHYQSSRA
jgi:hypothetical protein